MCSAPLYNWLNQRTTGVLLHPTSLPSATGIGNFGKAAYYTIDLLKAAGVSFWQLCPLGPTGYGDSPYQCFSAFAGNPYLIDLDALVDAQLLDTDALAELHALPHSSCDYGALYEPFWKVLKIAHTNFIASGADSVADYGSFQTFVNDASGWLDDYASFMGLKAHFGGCSWQDWDAGYRSYTALKDKELPEAAQLASELHRFAQYLFFRQYEKFRRYASLHGIEILGDLPIFVALDSADVWANPELFQLDANGKPAHVAGVPPDYFAADGQLWGNPLYDWNAHAADGFKWWLSRIKSNLELYDSIRLDHFRGFESYWSVPGNATTARNGEWKPTPGKALFKAIAETFPEARIIAEDLGVITPEVRALLEFTGLPGMAVLQFAFDGSADNAYLPHNLNANTVLYSGTHDNDTSLGWYATADAATRDQLRRYFSISGENAGWDLIRAALRSNANLAILPLQDLLSLGSEARLNTPGQAAGNWQWRVDFESLKRLKNESAAYLKELNTLYGRCSA